MPTICLRGFLSKLLVPYNTRELHPGGVYTVDGDGTAVRIPAYDVKSAPPPEEPVPADVDVESRGDESTDS